ncbi:hypothetical protein chiPu_0000299 [Chiloscyllium punctatum]|uniref:Uncharacterized protein n=1 Tax=Chiloscyllium punctatum TaxID=137246 RepID=A0A401RUX6_CHIPU|nr:hypothetical protein [Chiloscyllium punctatum]
MSSRPVVLEHLQHSSLAPIHVHLPSPWQRRRRRALSNRNNPGKDGSTNLSERAFLPARPPGRSSACPMGKSIVSSSVKLRQFPAAVELLETGSQTGSRQQAAPHPHTKRYSHKLQRWTFSISL